MTKKKTIILIAVFLIIVVLIVFLYYLFAGDRVVDSPDNKASVDRNIPNANIIPDVSRLSYLTDEAIVSPRIDEENNKIKYITQNDGILYESDLNGRNKNKIPFVSLSNLIKVFWSSDSDRLVNVYSDIFGVKRFYYDLNEKKVVSLNENINWLDYSSKNNKLIYHYQDEVQGTNTIALSEMDGTLSRSLMNTRIKDIRLKWIDDKNIEISTAPSGLAKGIIYTLNIEDPEMNKVLSDVYGLTSRWSRDASLFIFSKTNKDGGNLRLMVSNRDGTDTNDAGLATLPEKCTFTSDPNIVFCAEPKNTLENALMPDDYYKKVFSSNDRLWKLNLKTGKKEFIYEFNEDVEFDMRDLYLTNNEKYIYFINRNTGFLHRLEL